MPDALALDAALEALADAPHLPALLAALDDVGLESLAEQPLDGSGGIAWHLRKVLQTHGHTLDPDAGLRGLARYPFDDAALVRVRRWATGQARQALLARDAPGDPEALVDALNGWGLGHRLDRRALAALYDRDPDLASAHHAALKGLTLRDALQRPAHVPGQPLAEGALPGAVARALWHTALGAWHDAADQHLRTQALEAARSAWPEREALFERVRAQWQKAVDLAGPGPSAPVARPEVPADGTELRFVDADRLLARLPLVLHPPPDPLQLHQAPDGSDARHAALRDLCAQALDLLRRRHGPSAALAPSTTVVDDGRRVLALLDAELAADPAPEAWLGWRVDRSDGDLRLVEVRCTLGPDGDWKVRGLARDSSDLGTLPADARARERLAAPRDLSTARHAQAVGALDALVGHPRLFAGATGSVPLVLRRARAHLDVVPRERGVRTRWRLGQAPEPLLESAALEALVREQGDGQRGLLWHDPTQATLVDLQHARPIAAALAQVADWVPPAAVDGFLGRLPGLAARTPVRVDPRLAGEERPADGTVRVELSTLPGPALGVALRVLPGGEPCGAYPPGEGPASLYGADPGRYVVHRDPTAEGLAARSLARDLGLDRFPHDAWRWDRLELPDAVDVLARLTAHPDVPVVWRTAPLAVHTTAANGHPLRVRLEDRGRWFRLHGELVAGPARLSLTELLAQIRGGQRVIVLAPDEVVALTSELRQDLLALAALAEPTGEGERLNVLAAPLLRDLLERGAELELPPSWGERLAALAADAAPPPLPALEATLRPYQRTGVAWLQRLAGWAPGAVLADDMGLGKTVQALGLLVHRAEQGPALVVAPASVLSTWARAVERFAPSLEVHRSHGSRRAALLDRLDQGTVGRRAVVLTTWGTLVRDAERLRAVGWSTVVLDEAQAIKNARTVRARAVRRLQPGFTLALTGTPVENAAEELWALFDAVVPGLLGDESSFHTRFAAPIAASPGGAVAATLRALVQPFLLRRRKAQVAADLPPREEVEVPVVLSPEERRAYEEVRASAVAAFQDRRAKTDRRRVLAALTRLRQLASHPRLVDPTAPRTSAKLREVRRVLLELAETGHRALVFSQFTSLLDLLEDHLAPDGLRTVRLDGTMPLARRQQAVDAFQGGDAEVFLISLHAGGTGLNLTAATYVLHLDAWWNPAVHDQATDRAHRIGQDQPVTVLHFVAQDTVEEGILALQRSKRALVGSLLEGTDTVFTPDADALVRLIEAGGIAELDLGSPDSGPEAPTHWPEVPADPDAVRALLGDLAWPLVGLDDRVADRFGRWLTRMHRQRTPKARNHARVAWRLLRWVVEEGHPVEHVDDLEPLAVAYGRAVVKADTEGVRRDLHDAPLAVRAWLASR